MAWLSLIPIIITMFLTFKTKKLIISLFAGVIVGSIILKGFLGGITAIGEYMMDAVADKDSAYTLSFLIAFGSLAELIEMAGGIAGFSNKVDKYMRNEQQTLRWAWYLSLITFFDSTFHTIAVGTVLSPIIKKVKGSKEKFAFILSVSSLQLIIIIPIATAYLGYMVTLVTNNIKDSGISETAYSIVVKSVLWNFFSWTMIIIGILITLFGLGFGKFKMGKAPKENEEFTKAHIEKQTASNIDVEEYPKSAKNLIIPVIILLFSTIFFFWWTGKDNGTGFLGAISNANFSVSIFSGIVFTLLFTSIFYMIQKISLAEIESHIVTGGEKLLSLVIILILSWALTSVTQDLGFNNLINADLIKSIPNHFIPALIFLISGIVSYSLGSSWATWALIMPLAVSFSLNSGINIPIMVGSVWAGGAVADIISPLSAEMAETTYGEHLITSFPFLILGFIATAVEYLILGFFL